MGKRGGKARAKSLSPEQRQAIGKRGAQSRWSDTATRKRVLRRMGKNYLWFATGLLFDHQKDMTVEELAKRLKVPVRWIYTQTRKRTPDPLPCRKSGRRLLFTWYQVVDWLERDKKQREQTGGVVPFLSVDQERNTET